MIGLSCAWYQPSNTHNNEHLLHLKNCAQLSIRKAWFHVSLPTPHKVVTIITHFSQIGKLTQGVNNRRGIWMQVCCFVPFTSLPAISCKANGNPFSCRSAAREGSLFYEWYIHSPGNTVTQRLFILLTMQPHSLCPGLVLRNNQTRDRRKLIIGLRLSSPYPPFVS